MMSLDTNITLSNTNTSIAMGRARAAAFPQTIMANINNNCMAARRECRASWVLGKALDRLQALRSASAALEADPQRRHTSHMPLTPPSRTSGLASVVWASAKEVSVSLLKLGLGHNRHSKVSMVRTGSDRVLLLDHRVSHLNNTSHPAKDLRLDILRVRPMGFILTSKGSSNSNSSNSIGSEIAMTGAGIELNYVDYFS